MPERIAESALLLVIGMGTVFLSLIFIAGVIWLIKEADEKLNTRKIRKYAEHVESKAVDPELNDETFAVITAAVEVALRKPVTVRHIRFLKTQAGGAWSSSGRVNIMASHLIPKRK